jgi:hypothetical protein
LGKLIHEKKTKVENLVALSLQPLAFPLLLFQRFASSPFFIAAITVLRGVLTRATDPDPHYFCKQDPDPHYSEKLDPDPH